MSGISVLKFVSGNNFDKCSNLWDVGSYYEQSGLGEKNIPFFVLCSL